MAKRLGARDWAWIAVLMGAWAIVFALAVQDGLATGQGRIRVSVASAAALDAHPTVVDRSRAGAEPAL